MRAFFSHSSQDKAFVDAVASIVGGASVELDQRTFDFGTLNTQAILEALDRCGLFVMFVSSASANSPIVKFEARIAEELVARGVIGKMLFMCIDPRAFELADRRWKDFNFVRSVSSPRTAARIIQSALMELRASQSSDSHPFVGRGADLDAAKERIIDPQKPNATALFVSGNIGIGRRTFAKKLFVDSFPSVNRIIPEIPVHDFDGYDELYRNLSDQLSPLKTIPELIESVQNFASLTDEQKADHIAGILSKSQSERDAIILRDHGGLLQDRGAIKPLIQSIIERLNAYPHPPIIMIAERTPPQVERTKNASVVFCPLNSLPISAMRQLVAMRLKQNSIEYNPDQLERLVELSDSHPFNVNFIIECVTSYSIDIFTSNPSQLIVWKNKRTSEYVESIDFDRNESSALSVLRSFPALEFSLIVDATGLQGSDVADAMTSLVEKHIVEFSSGTYFISPPLKGAIERSKKFSMNANDLKDAMSAITKSLVSIESSESVPVSMVESGILAMLQADEELPEHISVFLLPSHLVWLARRRYDERKFDDSISLTKEALASPNRLSLNGKVEACRILCLSAARKNRDPEFLNGLSSLRDLPKEPWIDSTINFLLGFVARLNGKLPEAEAHQREAHRLRPGNFPAARELAFICLTRGKVEEAESFAREALSSAPDNPYILDILVGVLIQASKRGKVGADMEVQDLLDRLLSSTKDDGSSFYETRMAEYHLVRGEPHKAAGLIGQAAKKTPNIFNVQALRARTYVALHNSTVVSESIEVMNRLVQRNSTRDGKTNLRPLLEIRAQYFMMIGDFDAARKIYDVEGMFDQDEIRTGLRAVEIAEGLSKARKA